MPRLRLPLCYSRPKHYGCRVDAPT